MRELPKVLPVIRKAVFPVAGLGTRMLPATKAIPKEMLPVVDKPIIQYAFEEARAAGIEHFIFVTGRGKSVIEDHFDRAYELDDALVKKGKHAELESVSSWVPHAGRAQLHPPAGAARPRPRRVVRARAGRQRAVRGGAGRRSDPERRALPASRWSRRTRETGGNIVAVEEVARGAHQSLRRARPGRRRRPAGRGQGPGREARSGAGRPRASRSSAATSCCRRCSSTSARQQTGAGGEIQLTDAMARMIGRSPFHGLRFEGRRFDCGARLGYLEAIIACALEREDLRADDACDSRAPSSDGAAPAEALRPAGVVEVACTSR